MNTKVWLNVLLFICCQYSVDSDYLEEYESRFNEFSAKKYANLPIRLNEDTLKFVAVITRHGSRSPLKTYPNDPYPYTNSQYWPDGPGELTNFGKVQLYYTGIALRKQFEIYMDPIYQPNACEVTYNPYDRDFMSAACLTAGLFPPDGPQLWNKNFPWQPIVQSQRDFDVCDLAYKDTCPKFKELYNEQIKKFNNNTYKYMDMIDYVSNNAGMKYSKLSQMFDVYDTLLMQVENGYKVPQWTKLIFPFTLRPVAVNYLVEAYAGNEEQIRLGAGPVLKFIGEKMTMKANGTYDASRKFYIEAAHDCTLIILLKALGNKDPNLEIQTGAFLMFELHYVNSNYYILVLYYRSPYAESKFINITACPLPCTLNNFIKFIDSIHPPDWKQACRL